MGKLCEIIIFCLYIQACCGVQDTAPTQRNATPCVRCPKKTTTHRTTTHSTLHTTHSSTMHTTTPHPTTHTSTPHTTAHTNYTSTPHTNHTSTPHTTAHTNHTSTPHTTAHTNHTSTPHTTAHTNHTSTPHTNHTSTPYTTAHTNHTSTPHTTAHTNHTSTPHTTAHTDHTSTPHTTAHTNHTSTPHTTAHTNHTSTPHTTAHTNHTSTPHTTALVNHTTPHFTTATNPTTVPPSTEYIVNGTTGVCLRITASFNISFNDTMKREIVIPPAPSTQASGNCSAAKAWLTLSFPEGEVTITFRQDTEGKNFFLGEVNITLKSTGPEESDNASLKAMVAPLGRSFSCEKVDIQVTSKVIFSVMNVRAQAFRLDGGNYGREMKCSDGPPSMTVPIVVGVILVALVLIVVIAYIVARQRSQRGYQPL